MTKNVGRTLELFRIQCDGNQCLEYAFKRCDGCKASKFSGGEGRTVSKNTKKYLYKKNYFTWGRTMF